MRETSGGAWKGPRVARATEGGGRAGCVWPPRARSRESERID